MSASPNSPQPPPPPPPPNYRRNVDGEYKEIRDTQESENGSVDHRPGLSLEVRMIRELRHVLFVDTSSKYDKKIENLSEEEKHILFNFLDFASNCPMCKEENHESQLKEFYFNKDLEKIQIKEGILNLMNRSKALNIKINTGVLCCTCYKKIFKTRRENIQSVNLRRDMLEELRTLFDNTRLGSI